MSKRLAIDNTKILIPARATVREMDTWGKIARVVQIITAPMIFWTLRLLVKFEVHGQENLRGFEDKSVIFASNHASFLDGPACGSSLPRFYEGRYSTRFYPIRFLALKDYFKWINPIPFPFCLFAALYVKMNGSVPIEKAHGDLQKALPYAVDILNKGGANLWIYPEGARTLDGELHQGKRGIAYLHQQTGVPIVPVGIKGSFRAFKLKNLFLRRSKMVLTFGKPIYSLKGKSLEGGSNFVMEKIAELTGQTYNPNNK